MINLVNILDWSKRMLNVNGKSHVICHVLTLRIFGASKKLRFQQNREKVFNRLNFTNWVELHKGHIQGSRDEVTCIGKVTCKRHASCSEWSAFIYGWSCNSANSSRIKYRCQLVVRLKANKCYQKLLGYLSSYTKLLNIRLFARVSSVCVSVTNNIIVTTPGFVLIVLLIWSFWLYCSGHIVDCIALIALTVLLIVLFWLF